jgi:hypothetical protein
MNFQRTKGNREDIVRSSNSYFLPSDAQKQVIRLFNLNLTLKKLEFQPIRGIVKNAKESGFLYYQNGYIGGSFLFQTNAKIILPRKLKKAPNWSAFLSDE